MGGSDRRPPEHDSLATGKTESTGGLAHARELGIAKLAPGSPVGEYVIDGFLGEGGWGRCTPPCTR